MSFAAKGRKKIKMAARGGRGSKEVMVLWLLFNRGECRTDDLERVERMGVPE